MNRWTFVVCLGVLVPHLLPARVSADYREIEVAESGSLTGTITFDGEPPAPRNLTPELGADTQSPIFSEELVIDRATRGVQNTVVQLRAIVSGKPFEKGPFEMTIGETRIAPHLLVIPEGGVLEFRNIGSHPTNLRGLSFRNPPFNVLLSGENPFVKQMAKAEVVKVVSDTSSWLSAVVFVAENPYFAVTDEKGHFVIDHIPPGAYKVVVWHELLRTARKETHIQSAETSQLNLSMALPSPPDGS